MKKSSLLSNISSYLHALYQRYLQTTERSLNRAHEAASLIKAMEDEYFNGEQIPAQHALYGSSVMNYLHSELNKFLKTVRMSLTEFNFSRSWFSNFNQKTLKLARNNGLSIVNNTLDIQSKTYADAVLDKLTFIDQVVGKYTDIKEYSVDVPPQVTNIERIATDNIPQKSPPPKLTKRSESKAEETSVLPRSILRTLNRLKIELDPKSEEDVVQKFRYSQRRTFVSIKLVLLLVIVPFLTFQLSKHLIVSPIVERVRSTSASEIFLNYEMEEKALEQMQKYEEKLKFEQLLTGTEFSPPFLEEKIKAKVGDIAKMYRHESTDAIENVFADLCALAAFIWLLITSKREIAILKDFIDQVVYGLSDSAKAFIIILFTDIFVGFHSPHGWEVILSGVSRHLGLPENHSFIFLFIATFPVILDTIFKYWIFRYLNRISPSAVATYRNMNE
ncbi:proton extrusion protein PcxA [Chlorogloea sp. CCALA 695]|uniref:proton extrusion protein PcxA n=1 Tax=Chlorogloea sp. CCALA 695 TaxID=2107693 RepID=UPI000D06AD17|nr:proton extrusion protein PcxA [Chlorogloea sp. CCALA 695]PSB33203.1 proton extrusion protein PcxA [Chlorogloea sp. CCALA 695]